MVIIEHHKHPMIKVREKSCFCDECMMYNPMSVCENIVSGYVSHWDLKDIVRKPPFEDADIDIDIHDPIYSADYECVSNLVMAGLWHMYIYI